MSLSPTRGWMKKTAYIFNIFLNDQDQWDWKGTSAVEFWTPVKSRWTSYADFEQFFGDADPTFRKSSHYRLSALPEPLVGCEPLLSCCKVLPMTFVKAKRWYIYEQPPESDHEPIDHRQELIHMEDQIAALEKAVRELTGLVQQLQKPSVEVSHTETQTLTEGTPPTVARALNFENDIVQVLNGPPPGLLEFEIFRQNELEVRRRRGIDPPLSEEPVLSDPLLSDTPLSTTSLGSESEWLYLSDESDY